MSTKYSIQNRLDEKAISVLSNYFQKLHGDIFDIQFHGIKDNTPDTDGFIRLREKFPEPQKNIIGKYLNKVVFFQLKGQKDKILNDSYRCDKSVVDFCKEINLPTILFIVAGLEQDKSEPSIYWYYFDSINTRILENEIQKHSLNTEKVILRNIYKLENPTLFWQHLNELAKKDTFQDLPQTLREKAIKYKEQYILLLTLIFLTQNIEQTQLKDYSLRLGLDDTHFQTILGDIIDSKLAKQFKGKIIYQPLVEAKMKVGVRLALEGIHLVKDFGELLESFPNNSSHILNGLAHLNIPLVDEFLLKYTDTLSTSLSDDEQMQLNTINLLDQYAFRIPKQALDIIKSILKKRISPSIEVNILKLVDEHLKYRKPRESFDLLLRYSKSDSNEVSDKAKDTIKKLAEYNYHIFNYYKQEDWYSIQQTLLSSLCKKGFIDKHPEVSTLLLSAILSTEFHGTEMQDENTMSLYQGGIIVTPQLKEVRTEALSLLINVYSNTSDNNDKLKLLNIFESSVRLPFQNYSDELEQLIINDIDTVIIPFYISILPNADLMVVTEIESQVYWYNRRFQKDLKNLDTIKSNIIERDGYNIFKLLVGNSLVDDEFEKLSWSEADKQRQIKIEESVENYSSNESNSISLIQTILNNLKSFEARVSTRYFDLFLEKLSIKNPQLAFKILDKFREGLEFHLSYILIGLLKSDLKQQVLVKINEYTKKNKNIRELLHTFRIAYNIEEFSPLLKTIVRNNPSNSIVLNDVIDIIFHHFNKSTKKDELRSIFIQVLKDLNTIKESTWLNHLSFSDSELINELETKEIKILIENLVYAQSLDYYVEELLTKVIDKEPKLTVSLFKKRIEAEELRNLRKNNRYYSTIPIHYDYEEFKNKLNEHADIVIPEILSWFGKDSLSDYQIGNVLQISFNIDQIQKHIITNNNTYKINKKNVLRLISAFQGHMQVTDEFVRFYVHTYSTESDWKEIMGFLSMSGGVVTGEYGFVNNLEMKLESLNNLDEKDTLMNDFIEQYKTYLLARIKYEKESADEDIALRKQQFTM